MYRHTAKLILLGLLVACGALITAATAQEYEVRTFLDNSGGATTTTDGTFQYLSSSVKGRYVCPVCSYSRNTPGSCPNPWSVAAHSDVLQDWDTRRSRRLLSLTSQDMASTDKADVNIVDIAGTPHLRAVLGRPFKPLDYEGGTAGANMRRSRLYAAAANLINPTDTDGPVISSSSHLRFLVVPPSAMRREAEPGDAGGISYNVPNHRVMAQADPGAARGGDDDWRVRVLDRAPLAGAYQATPIADVDMQDYLQVGVNPYRVDDGDYWWVRYSEETEPGAVPGTLVVRRVRIEVYSVMYGWQGENLTPTVFEIDPSDNEVKFPFSVIVPSGAVRLTFSAPAGATSWSSGNASGTDNWATWAVGFMVRSNCRLIPGWRDMVGVGTYPPFKDLYGTVRGDAAFTLVADDPTTATTFGPTKKCWFDPAGTVPTVTTESDVAETSIAALPYYFSASMTGMGSVNVQWADDAGTTWTPLLDAVMAPNTTFYLSGGEWQYDGSAPEIRMTNAAAAGTNTLFTPTHPYVQMAGSRFMCTRIDLPPTGDQWDRNLNGSYASPPDETAEVTPALGSYPRVIIGWLNSTLVYGAFAPGSTTPQRPVAVVNRWNGNAPTNGCQACGAVWGPDMLTPAQCPYHIQELIVTVLNAGSVDYNGTYYPAGLWGGRAMYRKDALHALYWQNNGWKLAPDPGVPNNQQAYWGQANHDLGIATWVVRPAGSAPAPTVTAVGAPLLQISPFSGGSFVANRDTWRAITANGVEERVASQPQQRQVLPPDAIKSSGMVIPHNVDVDALRPEQMFASIPRYQPPSVPPLPTNWLINDYANDNGYRGGQVMYRNLVSVNSGAPLTENWDTFYKNPDIGYFQPAAGVWPFVSGGIIFHDGSGGGTEIAGRHLYCDVCGSEFPATTTPLPCPFDGQALAQIPIPYAVREEHLVAEEYEPFEVQVSVARKAEMAQTTGDVPVGRAAPGVRTDQPDTTIGPLTNHRAFPSDTSMLPLWPYRAWDSKILLRNEGNIAAGSRLGNVYDFNDAALVDRALDHYLRAEVNPDTSFGRKSESGPLTRDTFMPRVRASGPLTVPYDGSTASATVWNTLPADPGSSGGRNTYGYISAGSYTGRGTAKPVPLGQPVGTYTGGHLQYVDVNGNNALDYRFWDGSGWVDTDTSARPYNTAIDLPYEPLTGQLRGEARVVETRLPQNDYYSRDSDPVVLTSPDPGVIQIIWSTNRVSSAVAGAATAAAGVDPYTSIPDSTSPSNLVYTTTRGFQNTTDDPLYRLYGWPMNGARIADPELLTNDPKVPGTVTVNGAPWASLAGANKWAFWQRSRRHSGGVESTLHYKSATTLPWSWTGAVENFVFDSGLAKQGLRGFFQPGGAWLFWHAGTPGREAVHYRWDFQGTPDNKVAPLPLSNVTAAGVTELVRTVLPDGSFGTIRRPYSSPFTSTKDVSVFPEAGKANVFFSGFVSHEGQADICWAQFTLADLNRPTAIKNNFGKMPFARMVEEMEPDGGHQLHGSRHLDWLVGEDFGSNPGGGLSPTFEIQFGYRDTLGDGLPRPSQTYELTWATQLGEVRRDRPGEQAGGVYRVLPIVRTADALPAAQFIPGAPGGGYWIVDPNSATTPGGARGKLYMEINPAAGTIEFASPLLDEDNLASPRAALSGLALGGAPLEDVVVRINYMPYIYRVTRSGAQDDSPSAFWESDVTKRLVVFWRRTYPTSEAPHFGRPAFMYRTLTTTVQMARPPVSSWDNISGNTMPQIAPPADDAGFWYANPADIGRRMGFVYTSGGRSYTEIHEVIGWSREMIVPVDTVVGEGSMVAVPEVFDVPAVDAPAAPAILPAVRYWLFWSSPRGVYDMRLVEDNGATRATGPYDVPVHPSSDIYSAVVAPEFGNLPPERFVATISNDPT